VRVRVTDLFAREDDYAACKKPDVDPAINHSSHPVQRCIGVGPSGRFDERRDLVIELLAAFVETAGGRRGCGADETAVDVCYAGRDSPIRELFDEIQKPTTVTVSGDRVGPWFAQICRPAKCGGAVSDPDRSGKK